MEVRKALDNENDRLLSLSEDHFHDVKSSRIAPKKLQETFVAFANSDGGDLYIGIEDISSTGERLCGFRNQEEANDIISVLLEETSPSVDNVNIEFIDFDNKGLLLHLSIQKSPKVHYTANGDCFIRVNAATKKIKGDRITQLAYSKGSVQFERKAVESVELEDILDSNYLDDYLRRIGSNQDKFIFLRKQRLLTKKDKDWLPNVGCVLFFDEVPQSSLDTRCAIKVYRLRTTEKEYRREQLAEMPSTVNGPIEEVIIKTIEHVKRWVDGASYRDGDKLVELKYPDEALKEILVNAVIHRDYSLNDDIHVKIYDNRIEVVSPGRLPGYMTTENIYDERFSRNSNLVRMLHNLPNPLNHDIGEGLDTARNELKKAGLIEPSFEEKDNSFVVVIKHQMIASLEQTIIEYIKNNPDAILTNRRVRQLSGEDDVNKVKKALRKLREQGLIEVIDPSVSVFKYEYRSRC